jgi:hypothetical protein
MSRWLNSLPEVQARLATEFDGRAVNEQNLSAWKQGGYGRPRASFASRRFAVVCFLTRLQP